MTDPKAAKHDLEKAMLRAQLEFLRKIHREDVARLHRALRGEARRRQALEAELAEAKKANADQWRAQRETMLAVGRTATGKPLNGFRPLTPLEQADREQFLVGAPVRVREPL